MPNIPHESYEEKNPFFDLDNKESKRRSTMNVLLVNYPKGIKHDHVAATLEVLIDDLYDKLKPGVPVDFDNEKLQFKFKVTRQENGNLVIVYREEE